MNDQLAPARPGFGGDVADHLDLVWKVIARLPGHVRQRIDDDDAFQAGVVGLLNAKRLYDPARGAWSTFAWSKARWNILIAAGLTRRGWAPMPVRLPEYGL